PAILDPDCDIAVAAPRIAFGKLLNAGQTCVAPDYMLVPRDRVDEFVDAITKAATNMYPSFASNPDYTSIVSDRHFQRFGKRAANRDRVLRSTLSGGVTVNDACWHVAQENLPFGGVGASGSGAYHGEQGFRTFSKEKPVLHQARFNGFGLFRPPYGRHFE